jgi:hypothetical protein
VIPTSNDFDLLVGWLIDQAVFLVDPSRPTARQLMFEWFRFPYSFERVTLNSLNQIENLQSLPSIGFDPPLKILNRI